MNPNDPNVSLLERAAEQLGEALLEQLVFDDLILDLMPTQGEILGFSNRWYPLALETAQLQELPSGCAIRIVTAPVFLATKLEAFHGRGQQQHPAAGPSPCCSVPLSSTDGC